MKLEDVYKTFPSGATEEYKILRAFEMGKQEGGAKVKELETQIEKMKCCINDLVHLGEFNEYTDEEYFNYQVHEALNNAGQFIKEIKENDRKK